MKDRKSYAILIGFSTLSDYGGYPVSEFISVTYFDSHTFSICIVSRNMLMTWEKKSFSRTNILGIIISLFRANPWPNKNMYIWFTFQIYQSFTLYRRKETNQNHLYYLNCTQLNNTYFTGWILCWSIKPTKYSIFIQFTSEPVCIERLWNAF